MPLIGDSTKPSRAESSRVESCWATRYNFKSSLSLSISLATWNRIKWNAICHCPAGSRSNQCCPAELRVWQELRANESPKGPSVVVVVVVALASQLELIDTFQSPLNQVPKESKISGRTFATWLDSARLIIVFINKRKTSRRASKLTIVCLLISFNCWSLKWWVSFIQGVELKRKSKNQWP